MSLKINLAELANIHKSLSWRSGISFSIGDLAMFSADPRVTSGSWGIGWGSSDAWASSCVSSRPRVPTQALSWFR